MDTTIEVTPRADTGKGWARKARAAGQLPAVVYGPSYGPRPITLDPTPLVDLFRRTGNRNTVVQVSLGDGETVPCLVREVQRHPVSRQILHVDFYAVDREAEVEVMVPIRPVGRPKGAILGGRLRLIRRQVRAACRYDQIPESFEVDVSPMEIGDMLSASQISLPDGVRLVQEHDFNVVTVYGKRASAKKES